MGVRSFIRNFKTAWSSARYLDAMSQLLNGYGINGAAYRPFNDEAAMRHFSSWIYAASMLNANQVASVPKRLYVRKRPGQKHFRTRAVSREKRKYFDGLAELQPPESIMAKAAEFAGDIEEVAEPHPALTILKTVNPWMNGFELDVLTMVDLQVTGNHYDHYVYDKALNIPVEIWRMPPQYTEVIPSKESFIWGYSFGYGPKKDKFPSDEVSHYRLANPKNIYYGMGLVEAAWTADSLHSSKRIEDQARHDNMSRPDWLLSIKDGGGPDVIKRMREDIESKLRGAEKKGNFLVTSGAVTATALNIPSEEEGTPTRIIEEIAAIFGPSVAMLLSNDPTKASSQSARLGWLRNTIHPFCSLLAEQLNKNHLPKFAAPANHPHPEDFLDPNDVFIAYDPVAFEDREAQQKRIVAYVAGGVITPNEGRQEEGYTPHADGDELYPPSGNGGTSAVTGDAAVGQNNARQNEAA